MCGDFVLHLVFGVLRGHPLCGGPVELNGACLEG